eukprot:176747_1
MNEDCSASESKYKPNYAFGFSKYGTETMIHDNDQAIATDVMDGCIDFSEQFTIILNLEEKSIGYQYDSNDGIRNVIENIDHHFKSEQLTIIL